ncbi:hypothetical protein F5148DRAFT_978424 [Russula earlei]|uniref:Uncharacterized protein n=1 Tax=Russula earlei TaxID=71964 RepID=A0ACC0UDG3_9AGAM|nr:hypothetical protein F5148DRAFT_978424 [Russula earlei]
MPKIKPKRYHGYNVLLFVLGTLFPPLAVAARFGIGGDFWLNLFLTLAGYIPGHVHNFYIQNIRNNKNHRRTPKWAQRYGLVDTTTIKRKERRSEWAKRYDERHLQSTLENQPLEEGQNPDISNPADSADSAAPSRPRADDGELWSAQEEQYYGDGSSNGGSNESRSNRWHYPANFDDATESPALGSSTLKKKKKVKKDRFARTEDAYSISEDTSRRRKKKRSTAVEDNASERSGSTVPEDPEGGHYGDSARRTGAHDASGTRVVVETNFDHQF